jgi:uncharacterized coiled-coil protein SlyX
MGSSTATIYNELERLRAENRVLLEEKPHKDDLIVELKAFIVELQVEVERLRTALTIIANCKLIMKENDMRDFARDTISPTDDSRKS